MNGYQRVKAAIAGNPVDYRPVMLHNFQTCARENGLSMREFKENPRRAAESFIRNAEKYGLDGVFIDFDTATLAAACGCSALYPDDEPALVNGAVLKDITDVASLRSVNLESSRDVVNWLECSRLVSEHFKNEKYVRCNCDQAPFSLASMLRGAQDLMMDLLDEDAEDGIAALLSYCTGVTEQFIRLAAQTGAHGLSNGDSVAGPSMISPAMYSTYAMPYENMIAEYAHALGKDYFLHICGDTSSVLSKMADVDADVFELDYKTDINAIYNTFANAKTISGTIDPSNILALGTPRDVERAVQELLNVYTDSVRLIVCSGCALAPDVPEENIRAFINSVRNPQMNS